MIIVDINSTKFDYFIGKEFKLKNCDDMYILGKKGHEFYLVNLENHNIFNLLLMMEDYDNFYRIEGNKDFFGVLLNEQVD